MYLNFLVMIATGDQRTPHLGCPDVEVTIAMDDPPRYAPKAGDECCNTCCVWCRGQAKRARGLPEVPATGRRRPSGLKKTVSGTKSCGGFPWMIKVDPKAEDRSS